MDQRRIHRVSPGRRFLKHALTLVIFALASLTLICGYVGFDRQATTAHQRQSRAAIEVGQTPSPPPDWSLAAFKTVQLFLLNSGAEDDEDHPNNGWLTIARVAAGLLFLVVSSTVIARVLDDIRSLPGQWTRQDHIVLCGLGQVGLQLLDDLRAQGRAEQTVVIEANPDNPWLDYARDLGATVVTGDSTKANTLLEARAAQAREVFVVNGDDGVNLEVTAELAAILSRMNPRSEPLRIYVHIVDTNFATTLRPYCAVLHDTPQIEVRVFNVLRNSAVELVTRRLWDHAPRRANEVAHFVILGFGAMGQTLAVELAQLAHFPNRRRNRFTIADRGVQSAAATFLARFGRFTSWTSDNQLGVARFDPAADAWNWNDHPLPPELRVESSAAIQYVSNAEFVELPAGSGDERFAALLADRFRADGVCPVIFVCGQQDRDNFETAVQLRERLLTRGFEHVPVYVWLPRQPALAESLHRAQLHSFGECRSAASYHEITAPLREAVGRQLHDDYDRRAAESAANEGRDYAPQAWTDLADDLRESNRAAADHMLIKLNVLGWELVRANQTNAFAVPPPPIAIDLDEQRALAEMEHYRWVAERLLGGWKHCEPAESPEATRDRKRRKQNHNLIPFDAERMRGDFEQIEVLRRICGQLHGYELRPRRKP